MPVRVRITLLFSILVFVILSLVCFSVYYFSYINRRQAMQTRLTNRAITTARLLSQQEYFSQQILQRINASTAIAVKDKSVQAYDAENKRIYYYSDVPNDTISLKPGILQKARERGNVYFASGVKEAVAHFYTDDGQAVVIVSAGYDEEGKRQLQQLQIILWASFVGGIIIAFASGYIFSKRLLRPLREISDEVNEISAQNFARRIPVGPARDEWYYLSNTLNNLLNRLQESFEIQRRFISNASHELSTPLTSVSSQLEVSLQRDRDAAEYRKVMESVYQDVRHMSKLTQTLLEFAKASGSTGGLEIDLVRIDEILLRMPAEVKKQNELYKVKLAFENLPEAEEKLLVFGNEELLFTAVKNIVVNACKYSHNHLADVTLSVIDTAIKIAVKDTGIGIPEHELENIFQPFYRTSEAKSKSGFGLGLSLVNRIVKLHKGRIEASSSPTEGTLFVLILPVAGAY